MSHTVDGYELREELARGQQGVVWRAWDPTLRREVALKLLGSAADEAALARFRREAQLAARLRHPHVVSVLAAGGAQGRPYLVMDLVPGESLARRLEREGPLAPEAAARLALSLAEALDAAHRLGVLHRDVKPHNVLVTPDGQPRLTDFGLARDLFGPDDPFRTSEGLALGTPAYWPPEQARGERERIGPASDVFGLGGVLYTLLTGRLPAQGRTRAEIELELEGPPPRPSSHRPEVDGELERIVLRSLARRPYERYPTAGAMAEDLRAWLARGASAPPAQGPREAGRLRGAPWSLLATLVLSAAALVTTGGWLRARAEGRELEGRLEELARARAGVELQEVLRRGWEALARDDAPLARSQARRACALQPSSADAWLLAAQAAFVLGEPDAGEACARALELDGAHPGALVLEGLIALRAGAGPGEVRVHYDRVRELELDDARVLSTRARLATALGEHEAALADLGRALERDPHDAVLHGARGMVRARLGHTELAGQDYDRALELGPRREVWLQARAELALHLGDAARARTLLEEARARFGDSPLTLVGLGNLALLAGRAEEALALFERAQGRDPHQLGPASGLVLALQALGRDAEARAALARLEAQHPEVAAGMRARLGW